jgi:hypothetical protein
MSFISKIILGVGLVALLCGIGIFARNTMVNNVNVDNTIVGEEKSDQGPEVQPLENQNSKPVEVNPIKVNPVEVKPVEVKVEQVQKDAKLKEQIGQMLLIGFRGTEITKNSYIVKTMNDLNIGGIILFDYDVPSKSFPRNITNPEQTKKLIIDLKKFSPNPLFITVDAEGGLVNRLKEKY